MINLIPQHTKDLNYLYELVSERNKWFIKLRYIATIMLLCLYIFLVFFSPQDIYDRQKTGILSILISIFLYNIILDYVSGKEIFKKDPDSFHPIKFALLQIIIDLIALMILVYITGLIKSPFYIFFIFHAIIGSLILPGAVVYFIVVIVLLIFSALNLLVHSEIIPEFIVSNSGSVISMNTDYLILNLTTFWLMILLSVMFVNYLTSALYRREQQLIEAIQKIEQAEIEKQRYIVAVVHEVKSPLSVIVSYLNLLIDGIDGSISEKVKNILIKMKKRSDEAIELTNDILEVSKIKQLKELKKENTDIVSVIKKIFDKVRDKAESEKITLNIDDKRNKNIPLTADRHLLEILFSNIISNSLKYNITGGSIDVRLKDEEENILVSISDTGIGIPADEIKNISDEFFRASNAKSGKAEGTGLGLYVVKQIAEKHGGKFFVKSPSRTGTPDNPGTEVVIHLPINN